MATFFITSSIMVIAVLAARFLLKNKVSFLILYPLWGIVLLRLLIPVTFIESRASIMNLMHVLNNSRETPVSVTENIKQQKEKPIEKIIYNNSASMPVSGNKKSVNNSNSQKPALKESKNADNKNDISGEIKKTEKENQQEKFPEKKNTTTEKNLYSVLTKSAIIIWISGSVIFFMLLIISNTLFYKRLGRSRKCIHTNLEGVNVFISEIINTPCIAGIFRPSVYLPASYNAAYTERNVNEKYLEQVLAHEYTHIRHRDNIWAFMRTICLGIYWFNPFVWIAAFYSRQDAELACDETVLENCTDNERYNYGRMLIIMCQKKRQNRLCLATEMSGSKSNLKERIIMLSNSGKKKSNKCHVLIIAIITIMIAGCGLTKEKVPVQDVNPGTPASLSVKAEKISNNKTADRSKTKYKVEKIFQDFINNKIKSRPEWKNWKGNTEKLYFSIQYAADNTPCLLVTREIISNTNETIDAFIYYYDKEQDKVQLMTYLASNGTANPVSIKDGEFVICTHHSVRNYLWDADSTILYAQEIEGYFMNKEKYTYSSLSWKVPFKSKKLQLDARKYYPQSKIDRCANKIKKIKNFSKNKAKDFYGMYSDAVPVPFYINTEKSWNKFYNDGYFRGSIHRITWHGDYDNDIIINIAGGLSHKDFIEAGEKSSILVNGARLSYAGKFFSDEEVLYFLNWGYTNRAFILRTGSGYQASYDVYILDSSKWSKEDILKDNLSSANSPAIYLKLRMSKLGRADYDNDGEKEIAFYITENPFTLDGYKTFYMFDKSSDEMDIGRYELYSYTKEDYRHFIEQVCLNYDKSGSSEKNQQSKLGNYFENVKNNPGGSYKSHKNLIAGNKLSGYNYIINRKNYNNNYEFGSSNNYLIILEDDKTEIRTNIGISFNKKGEKQKQNAEISALVQYKGNGKFILKAPYSFKITD